MKVTVMRLLKSADRGDGDKKVDGKVNSSTSTAGAGSDKASISSDDGFSDCPGSIEALR